MAEPERQVGYAVNISPVYLAGGLGDTTRYWRVSVLRLSDRARTSRVFAWRWRARRFARSPRRLGWAFRGPAWDSLLGTAWHPPGTERFTWRFDDLSGWQRSEEKT